MSIVTNEAKRKREQTLQEINDSLNTDKKKKTNTVDTRVNDDFKEDMQLNNDKPEEDLIRIDLEEDNKEVPENTSHQNNKSNDESEPDESDEEDDRSRIRKALKEQNDKVVRADVHDVTLLERLMKEAHEW